MAILRSAAEADFTFRIKDLDAELRVLKFTGQERLSEPFLFRIDLVSQERDITADQVLGQPALLTLHGQNEDRYVNGLVGEFGQLGETKKYVRYSLVLVPAIWLLFFRHNCRIFQDKSVKDILSQILEEAGFTGDQYRFSLNGEPEKREYCVQYRETELNFLSRLLEEEGIFYYFDDTEEKPGLVMTDDLATTESIGEPEKLSFRSPSGLSAPEEQVYEYHYREEIRPGAVVLRDFNFVNPAMNLLVDARAENEKTLEIYDFPGNYQQAGTGKSIAKKRLNALRAPQKVGRGRSTCRRLRPGFRFTFEDHPRSEFNREYLIVGVEHSGSQPHSAAEEFAGPEGEQPYYESRFLCVPSDTPYCPERKTPKSFVEGPQTARVVGPSGEEIYTDEHGRVKVQFHWDRQGQLNESSSCWIRVSQGWAGGGYGSIFLPRVGQEVIVDFLEGDPDRPLITGRVHNMDHCPPYGLPGKKTQSVIKTKSYKGEGANEIRFEDQADSEQLYCHAQRDMDVRVLNVCKRTVDSDHHIKVAKASKESLKSRDLTIDKDEAIKIGGGDGGNGTLSFIVEKDVAEAFKSNHKEAVAKTFTLEAQKIVIEPGMEITLKVGGNFVKIDPAGITVQGSLVKINAGGAAGSASVSASASAPELPKEAEKAVSGQDMAYTCVVPVAAQYTALPPPEALEEKESVLEEEQDWIEIELVDEEGNPVPDELYRITLPDGVTAQGRLGSDGKVRITDMDPGTCQITFPHLGEATR